MRETLISQEESFSGMADFVMPLETLLSAKC